MKQHVQFRISALLVGAICSLASCEKEDFLEGPKQYQPIGDVNGSSTDYTVVNGRMVFADTAAFNKTTTFLNANKKTLAEWDENNNIISLQETYASINQRVSALDERYESLSQSEREGLKGELGVSERVARKQLLWVPDAVFASILNAAGEYQIGSYIHKVTQQNEYVVDVKNESTLKKQGWENTAIEKIPIQYSTSIKQTDGTATRNGDFTMWYGYGKEVDVNGKTLPETHNGRKTRMWASQWNVVWGLYASHGVRTQFEYKSRFAGWLDNDCSYIFVEGESAIIRPDLGTKEFVKNFDSKTDDDVVEATLQVHPSVKFMEIVYSISRHQVIYKGATAEMIL